MPTPSVQLLSEPSRTLRKVLRWLSQTSLVAVLLVARTVGDEPQAAEARITELQPRHWPEFQRPLTANERLVPIFAIRENPITRLPRHELSLLAKQSLPGGFARLGGNAALDGQEQLDDGEQLRTHWRNAIRRRLPDAYHQLDADTQRKIDVAGEVVITRFLREYRVLQRKYEREGGPAWGALQVDDAYEQLRHACANGPWSTDPLLFDVLNRLLR